MTWPKIGNVTGAALRGSPTGGQIVTTAISGYGYSSPGNLGYTPITRPTTFPVASGTKNTGEVLTCVTPVWAGANPTTNTYQWYVADGSNPGQLLSTETAATYTQGNNAANYVATSSTSVTITTSGTDTFTIPAGKTFIVGQRVRAVSNAYATNYIGGTVSAVTATTVAFGVDESGGIVNSTTSNTIGTGTKTFTMAAGLHVDVGQSVKIVYHSGTSNFFQGTVTSFDGTTLVVNVTSTGGSGTQANWDVRPICADWNILPWFYCKTVTTNGNGTFPLPSNVA